MEKKLSCHASGNAAPRYQIAGIQRTAVRIAAAMGRRRQRRISKAFIFQISCREMLVPTPLL